MSSIPVLLNPQAGSAPTNGPERVTSVLRKAGVDARIESCDPEALESTVRRLAAGDVPVLAIVGGDGSHRTAAQVLAGGPTALAAFPGGSAWRRWRGPPQPWRRAAAPQNAPRPRTGDPLELLLPPGGGRSGALRVAPWLVRHGFTRGPGLRDVLELIQTSWAEVDGPGPIPVTLDGEPMRVDGPARLALGERTLRVVVSPASD